jgi:O-antigen ligase
MKINVTNIQKTLLLTALFLLPWQTRFIFGADELMSGISEYGILSLFAVEILIIAGFVIQPFIKRNRDFDITLILGWLFILAALGSVFSAENRHLAVMTWLHVLVAYLFFISLLNEAVKPRQALLVFSLGLVVPSLLGIFQAVSGTSPSSSLLGLAPHDAVTAGSSVVETFSMRWLRAYGSFQHPNIFGGYLAIGLFAVFLFQRWHAEKMYKYLSWILAGLFSVTLVLTYSRSAWLAFALSFIIVGWMLFAHHRVEMRRIIPLGLIVLVIIFLTVSLFAQPVFTRFDSTARLESTSLEERLNGIDQWKTVEFEGGDVAKRIINGVGVGNYVVELEQSFFGMPVYAYQPVHNVYLLIFSELGLIGSILIFLWLASMDKYNYARIPHVPAVGALAMGNTLLIIGFFDHYIWSLWPGLALLAFVMAMTLQLSEPSVEVD